jgi:hypothetical protein
MRLLLAFWTFAAALLPAASPSYQTAFYFEPNLGQTAASVRYFAQGGGLAVLVEDGTVTTSLSGRSVVRMTLGGGMKPATVVGVDPQPGVSNYLDRKPAIASVPHFAGVRLNRVYPGIDMVYRAEGLQFEYDFHVAPGADPAAIRLRFSTAPVLTRAGDLIFETAAGQLRQHRPVAYQTVGGRRVEVPVRFAVRGEEVTFALASYDRSLPLLIDPPVTYLTYLGNPSNTNSFAVRTDGSGALYVFSPSTIARQTNAIGSTAGTTVTKFSATGQLVYSTRTDIFASDGAWAVDAQGFVYLADAATLLKLNQAGTAQVYRTTISFTGLQMEGMAVDASSNVYLTGRIVALPSTYTATAGAFRTTGNGFLMKYDAAGANTVYRTFLPAVSRAPGLAVDSAGATYFGVINPSTSWGAARNLGGGSGNFLGFAKLNPAGSALEYVFDFSAPNFTATNLAIDSSGNLFFSGPIGFNTLPVTNALQSTVGGGTSDIGLVKVNATGTAILFATYFGGNGQEGSTTNGGLAIDAQGNAWIGGLTTSTNLPLQGATQNSRLGNADGFLAQIKGDGSQLLFSTYAGSSAAEINSGLHCVAADNGAGYLAMAAGSGTLASVNAIQGTYGTGSSNLVVGKWGTTVPAGNQVPTVTSINPASGTGLTTTRTFVFTDANGANDLGVVNVLINTALDGRNACYIGYDSVNNLIVLLTDSGLDASVLVLPSAATVSNSQCSIAGSSITAVKAGNTLTLTIGYTFTSAFGGGRVIYAAARDANGGNSGWSAVGSHFPSVLTSNPLPLSASPVAGTATVGATFPLTLQYRDATSSFNLQPVQLLINSAVDGANACYFGFDHAGNFLYIIGDNGDLQVTPVRLNGAAGGAASIENSQCRLIAAGSTFTDVGNALTMTLQLQFKAGFAGRRLVFGGAQTPSGANSGWHLMGSLTVQ